MRSECQRSVVRKSAVAKRKWRKSISYVVIWSSKHLLSKSARERASYFALRDMKSMNRTFSISKIEETL